MRSQFCSICEMAFILVTTASDIAYWPAACQLRCIRTVVSQSGVGALDVTCVALQGCQQHSLAFPSHVDRKLQILENHVSLPTCSHGIALD